MFNLYLFFLKRRYSVSIYKKYGIYGIKNKVNGKIYIGKTIKSFGDRWDCHKASLRGGYNGNKLLQEDWDNFGEENFEFIIIRECSNNENLDDVNQLEIDEIKKQRDSGIIYNVLEGGDTGRKGCPLSEESKRKIGNKNHINMLGKKASKETKEKMSRSQKKRYSDWSDEERKEYGKIMSDRMTGIKKPILKEKMKNNKNSSKYTESQVREIRRLKEQENKSYKEISDIVNIPSTTVYFIATYKRWKDII